MKLVVTFHSVSSALYLEKLLKNRDDACRVIPVPRALSSSCGYAAETECDLEQLRVLFLKHDIEWEGIYRRKETGWEEVKVNRE